MNRRPNILLIMTDQHRADHLGCYGNPIVATPNIDALASGGRRFERCYVANPICMPNRASIMTGRMSSLHGARHNGIALSRDQTTFVELFRDAGYRTGLIGKSHLQSFTGLPASTRFEADETRHVPSPSLQDAQKRNRHGPDYELEVVSRWEQPLSARTSGDFYGFEHVEVVADHGDAAAGDYLLWARQQDPDFDALVGPDNALPNGGIEAPQAWRTAVPEELYSTHWIAERSSAWLTETAGDSEPFFLQMSFPDPHHPFTPPGKYWDLYDPADIPLPASFGEGDSPPLRAMREALAAGTDARDNQNPFAVTESEARALIALTYGSITMIDDAIGRVLATLAQCGLDDNTIVVFTSDHGDFMGDHGLMLKLLLHYQGLIRVPLVWRDPTAVGTEQGSVDTSLASSIDLSATLLARAGIQPYHGIQGRDLFSTQAPDCVIVEEDSQRAMTGFDRPQRIRTVVTERYRMTLREGEDWGELYDLVRDPAEIHNLFEEPSASEIRQTLTEQMLKRVIALQDRSPLPAFRA